MAALFQHFRDTDEGMSPRGMFKGCGRRMAAGRGEAWLVGSPVLRQLRD